MGRTEIKPQESREAERCGKSRQFLGRWGSKVDEISKFSFRVVLRRDTGEYVGVCDEIPRIAVADYDPRKALEGVQKLVARIAASCQQPQTGTPANP